MVPRIRLRPTYSSVTSTLALFVALSGGAYAAARLPANSVGSRQIKNNAVVRAKLRANAVNSSKVAANALKGADIDEASLAKVPSAAAADSAVHANAAAALDRLTYKVAGATAPAQSFGTATVACDPGQHVTGGGVRADDPIAEILVDSFPDAGNTAWTGRVWNGSDAGAPATGFTVYAICASAQTIG